jgi:hypothetical protein
MKIFSGAAPALMVAVLLAAAGCGEREAPERKPAPASTAGAAAASNPNRVVLSEEALRLAGIITEGIRRAPFATALALPARLSPVPETPEELEARLAFEEADARFQHASTELQRVRTLAAENVAASKSVQAAQTEFAQAGLERRRAETALSNLGMAGAHPDSYPGADFWALADVYESQVPDVKPGARAWVRVESWPDESFPARVLSLARFLRPQTRTLTARIAIQDPRHRLRAQETATVEVQVSEKEALSVPSAALLYEGTERVLFVKRGGGFEKLRVKVGPEQAGRAEILEGLSDGDEVVIRGAQILLGELFKSQIPVGDEGGGKDAEGD